MILHLGGDIIVQVNDIIAILDINTVENADVNREFVKIAEEEGFVKRITDEPPKSYVLAEINKKSILFISPISSVTLLRRSGFIESIAIDKEAEQGGYE